MRFPIRLVMPNLLLDLAEWLVIGHTGYEEQWQE